MKKTLLAAALAVGFAGVAQAETSVTLYGVIDTGLSYERLKYNAEDIAGNTGSAKVTRFGLHDGTTAGQAGSRWGLRGTEDLGNGLRAEFQLESGFNITTGQQFQGSAPGVTDRLFGRQAWLGLASDSWGSLRFGRQHSVGTDFMLGMIDPFGGGFGLANGGDAFRAINTNRMDNTVKYVTPNFSGFQFGLAYSFNQNGPQVAKHSKGTNANTRSISTGLRYANGPIGVALTYDQQKNNTNAGYADTTKKEWNLGGSYDFEVVKVSAAFGQTRNGDFGGGRGPAGPNYVDDGVAMFATGHDIESFDKGFKSNSYLLGLSAPVGAGTVMASWTMVDPRSRPDFYSDNNTDTEFKKQQTYALGYQYGLSKRTNVYAYGAYKNNAGFVNKQKATAIGVGLRHQF